ncbi:MAG: AlpA family phage regulatory protein [Arcobacteraceae bacterium]|jgi:predicted DNA-binding transcriptional regulator AlpA|nr:AlpA family phage regulatory protein [Arcobacteraceae bacterium]
MQEEKLLKLAGVMDYIPFSKSKIYELVSKNEFPSPLAVGGNKLWLYSDIQNYINKIKVNKQAS